MIVVHLHCDVCQARMVEGFALTCKAVIPSVRLKADKEGWETFHRRSIDICPDCRKQGHTVATVIAARNATLTPAGIKE